MQGFADHKSAPRGRPLSLEARRDGERQTEEGQRRVWKLMLDDDTKSGIEWQASLIESQFEIAARKRSEFEPMTRLAKTK
jgi:hypothetical protein